MNYEKMVDRNTLIVPLTRVCFKNGFVPRSNAITQIARRSGAFVMLDDYQDCGTRPVDVKALDLDFLVTGTLKYLLGPPGLAFMYVRKELISSLVPRSPDGLRKQNPFAFDPQHIDLSPTARRFESGSPSVPNVYAAVPGFRLLQEIGMENVAAHIERLTQALLSRASDLSIRAKTPADSVGHWWYCSAKIRPHWSRSSLKAASSHRTVTTACGYRSMCTTRWTMWRQS